MNKATYCRARAYVVGLLAVSLAWLTLGCGSGFSEILFQAFSAVGRSALDVALTDIANDLADAADQQEPDPAETDPDADDHDDIPADDPPVDDGTDPVADPVTGQTVYTDNGCAGCHCDDASGGCALSAPGLIESSSSDLESHLTGEHTHPVQADLSATELADLEAYLASLAG